MNRNRKGGRFSRTCLPAVPKKPSLTFPKSTTGRLRLMEMSGGSMKAPHMLIAGGTGGGKTYFILTLIEALLRTNAVLFVLDPRTPTLRIYRRLCRMCTTKEDMLDCIDRFYEEMMKRSENMKLMENYRTGENHYLGLPFLIFDEYVHLWKCSAQRKTPLSSTCCSKSLCLGGRLASS